MSDDKLEDASVTPMITGDEVADKHYTTPDEVAEDATDDSDEGAKTAGEGTDGSGDDSGKGESLPGEHGDGTPVVDPFSAPVNTPSSDHPSE